MKQSSQHDIVTGVNISAATSQSDLIKLTDAAIRRQLLTALPFSGKALRTILLFILFPGMIFGFWQGLILTGIATIGMIITVSIDDPALSLAITRGYLIWGCVTAIGITISTFKAAWQDAQKKRQYIPALSKQDAEEQQSPQNLELQLQQEQDSYLITQNIYAPAKGVYFYVIKLQNCDWATPPLLQNKAKACLTEWSKKEQPEQAFVAYRMEAGQHQISMRIGSKGKRKNKPSAQLSQINQVANNTPQ